MEKFENVGLVLCYDRRNKNSEVSITYIGLMQRLSVDGKNAMKMVDIVSYVGIYQWNEF